VAGSVLSVADIGWDTEANQLDAAVRRRYAACCLRAIFSSDRWSGAGAAACQDHQQTDISQASPCEPPRDCEAGRLRAGRPTEWYQTLATAATIEHQPSRSTAAYIADGPKSGHFELIELPSSYFCCLQRLLTMFSCCAIRRHYYHIVWICVLCGLSLWRLWYYRVEWGNRYPVLGAPCSGGDDTTSGQAAHSRPVVATAAASSGSVWCGCLMNWCGRCLLAAAGGGRS